METLNDTDVDTLTSIQNRLALMRKREAANTNSQMLIEDLTEVIEKVHEIRQWLQSRCGMAQDPDLHPFKWGL